MHSLFDLPRRKTFSKTKTIFGFFCLFCVQALLCCTQFHFQETHHRGVRFRGTQVWTLTDDRRRMKRKIPFRLTCVNSKSCLGNMYKLLLLLTHRMPRNMTYWNQDPSKFMLKRPYLKVSCSTNSGTWQWCVHGFVCLRFLYGSGSTLGSEFYVSQTGCSAKQDNFQDSY